MPIMYYGSKISDNMTETPEGYLICHNVPIGRIGYMDYLGEELGLEQYRGQIIKVVRKPEELFKKSTIASFEGKSVTNNHPVENLDINTVQMAEKGHAENVRQNGDFLVADLYIKDQLLINEIKSGKREVSCGYDALWVPIGEKEYEQKEIIGNHIAVVSNGRAGSKVAIKDSAINKKGGISNMAKKKGVFAKMFKAFAADASPEEIAEAMDAMSEGDNSGDGSSNEPVKKETKDDDQVAEDARMDALEKKIDAIMGIVKGLMPAAAKEEGADAELESLEKDITDADGANNEGEESETIEEEAKDGDETEEEKKPVADASLLKFVQDMKPIIMAIPDEKARNAAAKQFSDSIRKVANDKASSNNGYGILMNNAVDIKKRAADEANSKRMTQAQAAEVSVNNWNKQNAHYKG